MSGWNEQDWDELRTMNPRENLKKVLYPGGSTTSCCMNPTDILNKVYNRGLYLEI